MVELLLDVQLAVDVLALAAQPDPTQAIAELSRLAAEDRCVEQRATLRHPDPRELATRRAIDPTTGRDVLIVGSRWLADGPEGALHGAIR